MSRDKNSLLEQIGKTSVNEVAHQKARAGTRRGARRGIFASLATVSRRLRWLTVAVIVATLVLIAATTFYGFMNLTDSDSSDRGKRISPAL